jgi:tRNA (guanine37-N1)-methyltransferase
MELLAGEPKYLVEAVRLLLFDLTPNLTQL